MRPPSQAEESVALLQTGDYNLSYDNLLNYDALLAQINPELPVLFTNSGIVTDPNYVAFGDGTTTVFDPTYGGYNPYAEFGDYYTLFTNNEWNYTRSGQRFQQPRHLLLPLRPGVGKRHHGCAVGGLGGLGPQRPRPLAVSGSQRVAGGLWHDSGCRLLEQLAVRPQCSAHCGPGRGRAAVAAEPVLSSTTYLRPVVMTRSHIRSLSNARASTDALPETPTM